MTTIKILTAVVAAILVTIWAQADAAKCVISTAKAASDCIKGTNKECKAGIDKAARDCGL